MKEEKARFMENISVCSPVHLWLESSSFRLYISVLFESYSFQENNCYRFITSGLWKLQVTKFQLSYKSSLTSTLMAITQRHVLTISRIRSCVSSRTANFWWTCGHLTNSYPRPDNDFPLSCLRLTLTETWALHDAYCKVPQGKLPNATSLWYFVSEVLMPAELTGCLHHSNALTAYTQCD